MQPAGGGRGAGSHGKEGGGAAGWGGKRRRRRMGRKEEAPPGGGGGGVEGVEGTRRRWSLLTARSRFSFIGSVNGHGPSRRAPRCRVDQFLQQAQWQSPS